MVTTNVMPDLLKNVRSNLSDLKSGPTSSISGLPIGETNLPNTNSINFDSIITSATSAATHKYILDQMNKNKPENRGMYSTFLKDVLLANRKILQLISVPTKYHNLC